MLLPQRRKRRQQLRRRVIEVGQVLVASRKGNPVITRKGDASLGRRRFAAVVERDIRGAGSGAGCGREAVNEPPFRRGRLEKQHRIVRRRIFEVDLCETGKETTPEREIDGAHVIEKRLRFRAGQSARKCHDRVVEREGIGLRVIRAEVCGSTLVQDITKRIVENVDVFLTHRVVPGVPDRRHEGRIGDCLEATRSHANTGVARIDCADRTIRRQHVDHVLHDATVVEQPIAPPFQVGIPRAEERGESVLPHDIPVRNGLDRDVRDGGERVDSQSGRQQNNDGKARDPGLGLHVVFLAVDQYGSDAWRTIRRGRRTVKKRRVSEMEPTPPSQWISFEARRPGWPGDE